MNKAAREFVFTTAEMASQHVKLAEKIKNEPGVCWGLPGVDRHVLPMRGGDTTVLVARPGHGKTTVMAYLAYHEAQEIIKRGAKDQDTVVYATWEGTTDSIYTSIIAHLGGYTSTDYYWGRVDLDNIKHNVVHHGVLPIMFIGLSTFRRASSGVLDLDMLFDAVASIGEDFGLRPTLVCLDYLQLIPYPGAEGKVDQVARAIVKAKTLGVKMDVPFVLAAQAARRVDNYAIKLPAMGDIQWSSQAEQHADKIFGLWRPIATEPLNEFGKHDPIIIGKHSYPVTDNLLIMRMLKQRGDRGRHNWALHLEPETLKLAEIDVTNLDAVAYGGDNGRELPF